MALFPLPAPTRNGLPFGAPLFKPHGYDIAPDPLAPLARLSTIGNWRTFVENNIADLSARNSHPLTGLPPGWAAAWSPHWAQTSGPVQSYVSNQASNAPAGARVLSRLSHSPGHWIAITPVNVNNGVVPSRSGDEYAWPDLFEDDGTYRVITGPSQAKQITSYAGLPSIAPRFSVEQPDGYTFEIINGRALRFLDDEGNEYMHTRPVFGWCGDIDDPLLDGTNPRRALQIVEQDSINVAGKTLRTYTLERYAPDWADASGETHYDPTDTISGTTSIDDCYMYQATPDTSWNNHFSSGVNDLAGRTYRPLFRLTTPGDIPDGTITSSSLFLWRISGTNSDNGSTLNWSAIKNQADWGETNQTWNDYDGTNPWVVAGCGSQGTGDDPTEANKDFDATVSIAHAYTSYPSGPFLLTEMPLAAKGILDLVAWRDATRDLNGWRGSIAGEASTHNMHWAWGTENAPEDPYLTATYIAIPPSIYYPMFAARR